MLSYILLLITGCSVSSNETSDPDEGSLENSDLEPVPVEASGSCKTAMQRAEAETDFEESERLLMETLSRCQTADEWIRTLQAHPGAIGVTDESFVTDEDFVLVCWDNVDRRVCQDAIDTGRMPVPEETTTDRTLEVWFQWIPQEFSTEPAEADYLITVFEGDDPSDGTGEMYVTPMDVKDEMPSMDSGLFFTKTFQVPEGGSIHALGTVRRPPNEGRLNCLVVDPEAEVVLDYQEGQVGSTEPLNCWGFTHDDHAYTPGVPPVDVEFY